MIWTAILALFMVQGLIILFLEHRRPQRAVAWLSLLYCFPPFVLLIYYVLGRDYKRRKHLKASAAAGGLACHARERSRLVTVPEETGNPEFQCHEDLLRMLAALTKSPVTGRNATEILIDGKDTYEAMLEAVEAAREHIHLEVYILRDDGIGGLFRDALIRKARQGVKVRVLCDGLGSHKLGRRFVQTLKTAGIEVHFFLPLMTSIPAGRFNFRNHRKILVVDGVIGFTGGINIGDDYLGKDPSMGYWRDTHIRLEGDAVYFLQRMFLEDWQLASGERLSHPRLFPVHKCTGEEGVQIIGSAPEDDIDASLAMIIGAVNAAKQRIWIETPYFIPDPAVLRSLKNAVLRGADVRLIIPDKPDSKLVYKASLSYAEDLLDAGVKFYRYTKGFMHAKVWVADSLLASVGTVNMDLRSYYSNFELSAVLLDPSRIEQLANRFLLDLEECEPIEYEAFRQRGTKERMKEEICRLLSPLL